MGDECPECASFRVLRGMCQACGWYPDVEEDDPYVEFDHEAAILRDFF